MTPPNWLGLFAVDTWKLLSWHRLDGNGHVRNRMALSSDGHGIVRSNKAFVFPERSVTKWRVFPPSVWGCSILNSTQLLARNSSPRPVYSSLTNSRVQSIPRVPNPRVSPESPEFSGVPNSRVSCRKATFYDRHFRVDVNRKGTILRRTRPCPSSTYHISRKTKAPFCYGQFCVHRACVKKTPHMETPFLTWARWKRKCLQLNGVSSFLWT